MKILSAAAGIVLVAVSGWFGAGIIRSQTSALAADDGSGESARSSAMAGLSLAPTDLFLEAPSSVSPDSWAEGTLEPIDSEPAGEESEPGSTDSEAVAAPPETAGAEVEASEDSSTDPGTVPVVDDPAASVEPDRTVQEPQPESQREPDAVAPPELEVGDPTVSAYEAALGIFRQEMARYESVRVEFDDGAATCNPLNLAHRGVRESFRRLEQRYRSAAESTAAPQLRSFDGAGRQAAMVETHYGLTDCPMSPM